MCPVRALKAYKDKTKDAAVRWGRCKLFIPFCPSTDDIKPVHVSNWIVSLIKCAHRDSSDDDCRLANSTAHEVRSIATSLAVYNNATYEEIMQAADWSGQYTFTNFYSRAMAAHAEGLYDFGPILRVDFCLPLCTVFWSFTVICCVGLRPFVFTPIYPSHWAHLIWTVYDIIQTVHSMMKAQFPDLELFLTYRL